MGIIRNIDDGVKKVKIGDRVGIQPLFSSCLRCSYCMSRRESLCESAEITGEPVDGDYAEYISALDGFVTPIPWLTSCHEAHRLAEANEILYKLKNSEIDARAVLIP